MTQIDFENAKHKIDGYLPVIFPREGITHDAAFAQAKAECLKNLRHDLQNVEAITPQQFFGKDYAPKTNKP